MNLPRAAWAALVSCLCVVALHATTIAGLQMQTGNPTAATADPANHAHYLIQRAQYALDYNDTTRSPNWVAWDLTALDHGTVSRSDFVPDPDLPTGFYAVTTGDYNGVGNIHFNRGHMCPSADRNDTVANNVPVFYMTNITPQSEDNNQGPWEAFETECRNLAAAGNELLIISGPALFAGDRIPSLVAEIPTYVWKIVLVVPAGPGPAVTRVTATTRVIALKLPNVNGIRSTPWTDYIVSASEIEADTGYRFFTDLAQSVADALRTKVDAAGTGGGAPAILTPPAPQAVLAGTSATFTVAASGSPLTYQWRKDGEPITGATNLSFTIASVQPADVGGYDVVVSNASGSVASNVATLTVVAPTPPVITEQPVNQTATAGSAATFTVSATGLPAPTYQWYKNDPAPVIGAATAIAGATTATLVLGSVQPADSGSFYTVLVTNSVGSVASIPATLIVAALPPSITTQPLSQNASIGGNAIFSVVAGGSAPLSYQWRKNGTLLAGATASALAVNGIQSADGGTYDVVVTNAAGSATSNLAVLTVGASTSNIVFNFGATPSFTASPTGPVPSDITVSPITSGNSFGNSTLLSNTSVSTGYNNTNTGSGITVVASGNGNAGVPARVGNLVKTTGGSAYFEVTLTPAAGKQVTVAGAQFGSRSTPTGPQAIGIYASVDGYASALGNVVTGNNNAWAWQSPVVTPVTGAVSGNVTLRLYGYNGTGNATSGTVNWRIDDLNLTVSTGGGAVAPTVAVSSTAPGANAQAASVATPITIAFNQAVTTTGNWLAVAGATSGPANIVISPAPDGRTFTVTHAADFAYNENVTVTLDAARIIDQATGSTHPTGNYTFTFTTAAPTAPAIATQPVSQAVIVGGSATLGIVATGTAPLSYQWRKDGSPLTGATQATLSLPAVALADAGSYDVVVNNVTNRPVTSNAAVLTVSLTPIAPSITAQPLPQVATFGGTATFTVAAGGTTPLGYQWRKNGSNLVDGPGVSGANSPTLTLSGVSFLSTGSYDVVVSNSATPSATSAAATLTVNAASGGSVLYFTGGTYGQTFNTLPASGGFTFTGNGPYPLDAAPGSGGVGATGMIGWSFAKYSGTGANALFAPGTGSDTSGGALSFGASSSADRALGSLSSNSVVSRFGVILVNATGQTINQFTLGYVGEQWRKGGSNTPNTLTFAYGVGASDVNSGTFIDSAALSFTSPVVSSTSGAVDGNAAANRTVVGGQVTGLNWAPGQALVLRWSDANDAGSDDGLAIDDLSFSLAAPAAPVVTAPPVAQTVSVNGTATFSVTATGTPAPAYQWRKNGVPINGATGSVLTLGNVAVTAAGDYDVVVANGIAPAATSAPAALVVNKLPATVQLAGLAAVYDGSPKAVAATTLPAGLPVVITYDGAAAAPVLAGSYAVVATINSPTYEGSATGTLAIAPATPVVTWAAPAPIVYGTPLGAGQLNATANVPGTFVYAPAAGAVLGAGSQVLGVVFTPADARNYVSIAASTTLAVARATPALAWAAPAQMVYGTRLGAAQLNATASVPGAFTYAPPAGTLLDAGPGQPLAATFHPTDSANYTDASVATTITVDQATAELTLAGLYQAYDGAPKTVTVSTVPANLHVDVTYDGSATAPTLPGSHAVVATVQERNYRGTATGTLVIAAAALVNHAPAITGGITGSIQVMTAEPIALNGAAWISGDLLVPGTPPVELLGKATLGGIVDGSGAVQPDNYTITLNNGAVLGRVVRRTDPLRLAPIPAPAAPIGVRDVAVNNANQAPANFANVRNVTLNGNAGAVAVPAGIYGTLAANGTSRLVLGNADGQTPALYQLQGLELNGSARLELVGPVTIVVASGVALGGEVGHAAHPAWLTLAVASGGVTLHGTATLHGTVVAPAGEVVIGGTLEGSISADRLTITAGGVLDQP